MTPKRSLSSCGDPRAVGAGFSLVELMAAMTVTLLIMGSVLALVLSARKVYEVDRVRVGVNRSLRAAADFLVTDVHQAGERLPGDLFFVIVTDSPDYVRESFGFLDKLHICVDTPEPVDLSLFALCKYNIVANSTFSWWGAWLNQIDGQVVIAPEYFMGWSKRMWIPWAFEHHPGDWTYLDVLDLVEGDD